MLTKIPAIIPFVLGIVAGSLFLSLLIWAAVVTRRNHRRIREIGKYMDL